MGPLDSISIPFVSETNLNSTALQNVKYTPLHHMWSTFFGSVLRLCQRFQNWPAMLHLLLAVMSKDYCADIAEFLDIRLLNVMGTSDKLNRKAMHWFTLNWLEIFFPPWNWNVSVLLGYICSIKKSSISQCLSDFWKEIDADIYKKK